MSQTLMNKLLIAQANATEFPHYEASKGDGIVYVGGGKYWAGMIAGIRLLRDTGCTLPVQIWYRGQCEKVYPEDILGLNVELIDADLTAETLGNSRIPRGNVNRGGWESKLYALYNTKFSRVLFLDADAYCVADPTPVFAELVEHPLFYWRDTDAQLRTINWKEIGVDSIKIPPIQGGEFFIDRIKCQKLIALCNWMCQHSDYYFKHMFGDQDTWRVGLTILGSPYKCSTEISLKWMGAFECRYKNKPLIIHRCQGKLFELKDIPTGKPEYTNPNYDIPKEAELFTHFAHVVNNRPIDSRETFENIYSKNLWFDGDASGSGSVVKNARSVIDRINGILVENNWKSVIDVGCGTGVIGGQYNAKAYIGYDCCPKILEHARRKNPGKTYTSIDILLNYGKMNAADCVICKDVLHHHSNAWVTTFIETLIRSKKYRGLIFVQDCGQKFDGQDCHTGGFRPLSRKMKPLSNFKFDKWCNLGTKELLLIKVGI